MVGVIYIIPIIIIIAGYLMNKYPPKKVNWFIGYRTRKSMKDETVWKIANEYCGKLWVKIGWIMLVVATIICILSCLKIIVLSEILFTIIVVCEIIPLLLSGIIVENKLKDLK